MTRIRSLIAGGLVAGLLVTTAVYAQGGPGFGGPGGPAGRAGRLGGPDGPGGPGGPGGRRGGGPGGPGAGLPLRELNLSEAQQQRIRELTERRREDDKGLRDRLEAAVDAQRKAVEAIPVNEGAIRAAMAVVADAEADLAVANARLRAEIYGVLTPQQQATVKKLQAEREAQAKQRRETRDDRRPGQVRDGAGRR